MAAPVIYLITVGVGILNGLGLIVFERNTLLTHDVHAGTLGAGHLGDDAGSGPPNEGGR